MKFYVLFVGFILSVSYVTAQKWTNYYQHPRAIQNFSVNRWNDHLAIHDSQGLKIVTPSGTKEYRAIKYNFPNLGEVTVDLSKIKFLKFANRDLYVATQDSNLLLFDGLNLVGGIPFTYIYDCAIDEDDQFVATFDFLDKRYFGDINVADLKLDAYGEFGGESFYGYDVRDISLEDIYSTLEPSTNTIINLTGSNTRLNVNTFNVNLLPFNEFRGIEAVNLVKYIDSNGYVVRKFNLWALTDVGLALYSSDRGAFDFKGWTEDKWQHFTTDNSWLRTNNLMDLQRMQITSSSTEFRNYLLAISNDPVPTLYFFDAKGEQACVFTTLNAPIESNKPIRQMDQDGRKGVFVSQDRRILKLELEEDMFCETTHSKDLAATGHWSVFPNPASDYLTIRYPFMSTESKLLSIYTIDGKMIEQLEFPANTNEVTINTMNYEPGIYFIRSRSGYACKFVVD